jgi:Fe-S oxidoreductase
VIEATGHRVRLPGAMLCCQRPLYAEGMLDTARRELARILDALAGDIAQGTPVIGLEPSCVSAFRDELPRLFPANERATRLAERSLLLSEWLVRLDGWIPPRMSGRVVVHPHCHHHAVLDAGAAKTVLRRTGLEVNWLDAGCCGMAGSFGFRTEAYEISQRIAGQSLLPRLAAEAGDAVVVATGFSCREQIAQATGRLPAHLAEVLARALPPGSGHAP